MVIIDAFSKYAWVHPVKTKTGQSVTDAFEKISVRKSKGRTPKTLQTDAGKEFYNVTFRALMKRNNIHLFSTHGDTKASIVDRFNRTFKERMYRYFTAANTLKYINALPALLKGYNASTHRSIGMPPSQERRSRSIRTKNERTKIKKKNEDQVWHTLYDTRLNPKKWKRPTMKQGDRVRLNEKHRPFKKGYLPGWTEEVFVIRQAFRGPVATYKLEELDETPIEGTFYEQDLQKVHVSDDDSLFRIEKILKRTKDKVIVQWKGWTDKYNSWVYKSLK